MNYFSLFCKLYLALFLTFIIGTPILCCTTTDLGTFWYCSRDFQSCICESPGHQLLAARSVRCDVLGQRSPNYSPQRRFVNDEKMF